MDIGAFFEALFQQDLAVIELVVVLFAIYGLGSVGRAFFKKEDGDNKREMALIEMHQSNSKAIRVNARANTANAKTNQILAQNLEAQTKLMRSMYTNQDKNTVNIAGIRQELIKLRCDLKSDPSCKEDVITKLNEIAAGINILMGRHKETTK